jgi:predicted MFS family arabinose efflux permease
MARLRDLTRVLRHRDFRLLWAAQSLSVIGDGIVTVALALFVTQRTGSATDLGVVLAAHALPLIGFLLVGGVWADRLARQRLIVVTDLARFSLHALLALLIVSGEVRIWQVVAIEALFGTAEAFFRPAATALVPQTVPEAEIQEANALTAISGNVAEFVGPALATALVLGVGAATAFALDAATFLFSAALVIRIRPRRREVAVEVPRGSVWTELRDGFEEVRSRQWVWVTLAAFCAALFFALAPWYVLGPVIAEEQYGEIAIYGVTAAALGAGTILGSLAAIQWRPRYPMRLGMLFVCAWPFVTLMFAAGVSLAIVLPAMVVAGAGIALFDVWWLTALAERIPADKLARVTSYDWTASLGLVPLGYLLAGPLAATFGAIEVLVVGSLLGAVALATAMASREIRTLPRIDAEAVPEVAERRPMPP